MGNHIGSMPSQMAPILMTFSVRIEIEVTLAVWVLYDLSDAHSSQNVALAKLCLRRNHKACVAIILTCHLDDEGLLKVTAVTYTVEMVISRQHCKTVTLLSCTVPDIIQHLAIL